MIAHMFYLRKRASAQSAVDADRRYGTLNDHWRGHQCGEISAECGLSRPALRGKMSGWVIGIDLGATKTAMGLVDPEDNIVSCHRIPTLADRGPQAVVNRIADGVAELVGGLPAGERVDALGICTPGPVDHKTGVLLDPPNLLGLHNTPLRQMLVDRLHLPITLEHDAKAAALGEYYYGNGRGERSLAYIVVGTGVGAAFILDGTLYRGVQNSAGEVGGLTIDRNAELYGNLCGSGIRGCVQGYTCGPALAYHYHRLSEGADPAGAPAVTGAQVAQLAALGDEIALKVIDQAGEALGVMVANLAMVLDIELYVVGGSVAKAGDRLFEAARRTVPYFSHQSIGSRVRIVPAELGDDGPILGCGWLARRVTARG
jgi:glucokinase